MACHGRAADGGCRLAVPRVESGAARPWLCRATNTGRPGRPSRRRVGSRQQVCTGMGRNVHTADGWPHIRPVGIAPEQAVRACGAFRAMDVTSVPTQRIVFGELAEQSDFGDLLALCSADGSRGLEWRHATRSPRIRRPRGLAWTSVPSESRSVLRRHGWRVRRRVAAGGGACRAVVDEPEREWRPGEQIVVELHGGQVVRCRILGLRLAGLVAAVPPAAPDSSRAATARCATGIRG